MKRQRSSATLACPFCGELDELYIDPSGGEYQTYTEDCAICCRPRVVHVSPGEFGAEPSVWLEREE